MSIFEEFVMNSKAFSVSILSGADVYGIYNDHTLTNHGSTKDFQCDFCGKSFFTAKILSSPKAYVPRHTNSNILNMVLLSVKNVISRSQWKRL